MTSDQVHIVVVFHQRQTNTWQGYCTCGVMAGDFSRKVVEHELAACRAAAPTPKKPPKEHCDG